jgi:hypothetical protein
MTGAEPGKPAALASRAVRCGGSRDTCRFCQGYRQLNTMLEGK